jgi:hypothetical protein
LNWTEDKIAHIINCVQDPEYLGDTFAWMDADEGIVQFNMGYTPEEDFYYQREILQHIKNEENVAILKSRRAGLSWIAALICAWGINFHRGWNALLVSRTETEAISLLRKVKFILNNLAFKDSDDITEATSALWLKNEIVIDNQKTLAIGWKNEAGEIVNMSMVQSSTTTKHAGRGEKTKFVFIDEVQFVENQDEVFGAALTTAARAGHWMMGSNAGDVGTRFHKMCMMGRSNENKTFWYREVWPEETGIDQDTIDKMSEAMPEDIINQEWYLTFRQPGNAVFDATHLAACYKPPSMYPEIKQILDDYREKVKKNRWEYYYFSGVDTAVGKAHRKSNEKDYHCWVSLTATGIQAYTELSKKPLSWWAGETDIIDGNITSSLGRTSQLHKELPGLAIIEEDGAGYTTLNRHIIPEDGISAVTPIATRSHVKNRLIRNLIIAIESHSIVITDEKTYQQLSMYQYGDTPDTFEAPVGFNDDAVMAFAFALEGLRREGGFALELGGKSLDTLELKPFDQVREDMLNLEQASVVAANLDDVPIGVRPHIYMPLPFNELPDFPDWGLTPNPDILKEI